jgi:lysophospholipase L1-like esterase
MQSRKLKSTPPRGRSRLLIGAGVILALLVWALWASRFPAVTNLDSRGSTIIAFGDSLTAGYGAGPGEDYPSRLSEQIGLPIVNAGISGDTTDAALARLDHDVLSQDPRIVIVGLGGNDLIRHVPIAATEANLRAIIRKIQTSGAMVVLIGFQFPSFSGNYEKMYERVADEERSFLITGTLKGILNDPALKSDEIHPNARGYALMAERIAGPLQKLLKKAGASR